MVSFSGCTLVQTHLDTCRENEQVMMPCARIVTVYLGLKLFEHLVCPRPSAFLAHPIERQKDKGQNIGP